MPFLTVPISHSGPVIEFYIAVSKPRATALRVAGRPVPQPISARCLIDTGASCTALDSKLIATLELSPSGSTQILTPSTGNTPHACNQYDVALFLSLSASPHVHPLSLTIPVVEATLDGHGIQGLIGRDVLASCVFSYNGPHGHIFIAV